MNKYTRWIDITFGLPNDSDLLKSRKRIVINMQLIGIPLAIGFIFFFFLNSIYFLIPGFIVLIYLILIVTNFLVLAQWKKFKLFVWNLVAGIILLAAGIHIVQGGFYNSSGTLLYAFIAPAFATTGFNRKTGVIVLILYMSIVVILKFFEPKIVLFGPEYIPNNIILMLVVINLCATGFFVFSMLILLMAETDLALNRADNLLLNLLPAESANELKLKGSIESKKYEQVTVLFTDFISFTSLSEFADPEQLVRSIDHYYRAFDDIISRYELEKIKTIGDSYMCAGGIPIPTQDHAINSILAAKDILAFVESDHGKEDDVLEFKVRVGVHTGPVVAGIVGSKKWQYDIWGDTVNIASRMESNSASGKINISESTYNKVKNSFSCIYRGELEVKNRGKLKMYFVE